MDRSKWQDYELLDCGGEKLERWGEQYLVRPDPRPSGTAPEEPPPGSGPTPVSPQPVRRRRPLKEDPAGELEDPPPGPDLPGEAHELQAHGLFRNRR